ncbi:bifunctional riboflavin kinase/FAD synthetase [Pseudonocardia humida]|uniref:Riboflavin biosynthesis protein n=1 Tax=Pseudonocardia humida TaxID=2800819 RepID=A0ABT0ZUP5_9PSEU|nr:bifunctional riboflavin kinase/FAD synthetase [Pseudonocardia humida]MCO1654457.1 bifunctional riboflavin kinase/FAD synthetase [Pseudonocardia humida]
MQRWRGLEAVPNGWGRSVVTVGVFDGVHRGHQQLIGHAVRRGRERDLPVVVVTFDPHPAEVVRPGSHPARLTALGRRADLVAELGVEAFCVLPFSVELSRTPPAEFAHEVLVERLHAADVVVGRNFTFGHRAQGDVAMLTRLGERFGFGVEGLDLITDDGVTFSSTYIRSCIDAGDVEAATTALGRPHRVEGVVVHGDRRGRELGFPTANVSAPPFTALPADGVYAGRFAISPTGVGAPGAGGAPERRLPAAISVGTNPTFSGRERTVEAYVLDVDEDFYGFEVAVDFTHRLRGQERFDDVDALVTQMHKDVARTRELLGG